MRSLVASILPAAQHARPSAAQHVGPLSPPLPAARPRARRPRRAAGCVLRVPQRLLLHEAVALADARFGGAFRALRAEAGPDLDARATLCLLLLLERALGPTSAWAPYIDVLPDTYGAPRRGPRLCQPSQCRRRLFLLRRLQGRLNTALACTPRCRAASARARRRRGAGRADGRPRTRRAGDPTWWSAADLALVEGTRLGAAAAAHAAALRRLAAWRDRLLQLHGCARASGHPTLTLHLPPGRPGPSIRRHGVELRGEGSRVMRGRVGGRGLGPPAWTRRPPRPLSRAVSRSAARSEVQRVSLPCLRKPMSSDCRPRSKLGGAWPCRPRWPPSEDAFASQLLITPEDRATHWAAAAGSCTRRPCRRRGAGPGRRARTPCAGRARPCGPARSTCAAWVRPRPAPTPQRGPPPCLRTGTRRGRAGGQCCYAPPTGLRRGTPAAAAECPATRPALRAAGAEGRGGIALVPVADMLDHDPRRHVAWHAGRAGDEDFQFIARAAVPRARAPRRGERRGGGAPDG